MPNIKISDLPPITLPAVGDETFFEVQTVAAGQDVSRKISLDEIVSTTGLDASFITAGLNAQLPNERVLTAGTGIALTDNGPNSTMVVEATSGGLSGLGVWRYRTETGTPPASGQIRFNNSDPELATELFIAETNDGGTDVETFLALLDDGSLIYIQEQSNSANFIIVEVDTNTDSGTFRTIGIQAVVQQGAALSQNTRVIVVINIAGQAFPDPLLLSDGSAAAPSYSWSSAPSTGIHLIATNLMGFSILGTTNWEMGGLFQAANNAGPAISNTVVSATVPGLLPAQQDPNTGIGSNTLDQLSLIAGGAEIARATAAFNANQFAIIQSGSSSVPELTSLADPDTGFRWPADNTTVWIGGGTRAWNFSTAKFFSQFSNGPALLNEISSDTNPTVVADHADPDTGMGSSGNDELSLIAGGVEGIRIDETAGNVFITYFGPILVPFGSGTQPGYAFDGDDDTGIFRPVDDALGITAGGVESVRYAELSSQIIQTNSNQVGLTASVTQTQAGGLALLSSYNEIATVATTGDALTAFTVKAGDRLVVINNGANDLQLFPAVGDDIGAGVDTAITIAAGDIGVFIGRDATNWDTLYNATPSPSGGGPGGVLPVGTVSEASLKWDGVSSWIEEIQIRLTGGSTGITILDVGGTDNIRIGHDGSNALVRTTGSAEVIFGGGGAGPTTGWRFEQLIRVPDGSAAVPGITWFGDIGTGIFRGALGLSVSITGVEQARFSNATTQIFSDDFRLQPNIGADSVIMRVNPPADPNDFTITLASLVDFHIIGVGLERFVLEEPNLAMNEKAAAPGDVAGTGQWWVRDDTPNTAMFTNDAGVDKSLVNDAVQARRTTDFTITTAFSDVTLDTTDVETDSAVLDHDLVTNTDNIIVGQPGTYEITYGADIDPQASGANNIRCFGRVRINDAGVDIPGSLASTSAFEDSSIDGDFVFSRLQCSFIVTLAATDFLTLQLMKVEIDGSGTFIAEEVTVTAKRLL